MSPGREVDGESPSRLFLNEFPIRVPHHKHTLPIIGTYYA